MQKDSWLPFISEKIRAQISIENGRRVQTWAFGILALFALTNLVAGLINIPGKAFLIMTQVLFVAAFHLILSFGIYLPEHLQKGEKYLSRAFGIRDFTSLIFMSLVLAFVVYIVFNASYAIIHDGEELRASAVLAVANWLNVIAAGLYLGGFALYLGGLLFLPRFLTRVIDQLGKQPLIFMITHGVLFLLTWSGYSQVVEIGSGTFFEQVKLVTLFWVFSTSFVFWVSRLLQESPLQALSSLEMDAASGKLDRSDDLLEQFQQAFISRRFNHWLERLSQQLGKVADEITLRLQDCIAVVNQSKPTEAQLGWMEDRYRKAVAKSSQLERRQQKFLLALSFLNLLDVEREKVETLKDQFSKETRHAKLELAGVRKKIDEKLQTLKESERSAVAATVATASAPASSVPTEKVPVSR